MMNKDADGTTAFHRHFQIRIHRKTFSCRSVKSRNQKKREILRLSAELISVLQKLQLIVYNKGQQIYKRSVQGRG